MATDVIQFGADATQYFDVIARMQQQLDGLQNKLTRTGGGGDHIGESMLRSERIVSRSAANMATNLLTANDAGTALATTLLSFEHATKLGLGLAVGLAVGIAAFEAVHKQLEETRKAREALEKDISRPLALEIALSPADISARITTVNKELDDLRKKSGSISNQGVKGFTALGIALDESANASLQEAVGKPDANESKISEGEKRIRDLVQARADAELKVVGLKQTSIRQSQEQADKDKADLDFLAARSKLFEDAFKPGADQVALFKQQAGISQTRDITKENAFVKAKLGEFDQEAAEDIAKFKGTPEEKKQFSIERNVRRLDEEHEFLDVLSRQEEAKKKQLDLDQSLAAKAEYKLQLEKQAADVAGEFRTGRITVETARAEVNLGPEATQRAELSSQVKIAQERVKLADALLDREGKTSAAISAQTKAIDSEQVALAKRAKFENETAFKNSQELKGAKAATQEASLQSQGQNFQASILKAREAAEQRIAALLHDQKGALAGQAAEAAKIGLVKQLGDRLAETPAEQNARENAEREQARRTANAQAAISDAADRESRGAILDENNPVTQALRAAQGVDNGLAGKDQAGDFSSIASLAGQDFSSLAGLGNLDFSGIATLAGLSISIA